jgi:hypothetical protein
MKEAILFLSDILPPIAAASAAASGLHAIGAAGEALKRQRVRPAEWLARSAQIEVSLTTSSAVTYASLTTYWSVQSGADLGSGLITSRPW